MCFLADFSSINLKNSRTLPRFISLERWISYAQWKIYFQSHKIILLHISYRYQFRSHLISTSKPETAWLTACFHCRSHNNIIQLPDVFSNPSLSLASNGMLVSPNNSSNIHTPMANRLMIMLFQIIYDHFILAFEWSF